MATVGARAIIIGTKLISALMVVVVFNGDADSWFQVNDDLCYMVLFCIDSEAAA